MDNDRRLLTSVHPPLVGDFCGSLLAWTDHTEGGGDGGSSAGEEARYVARNGHLFWYKDKNVCCFTAHHQHPTTNQQSEHDKGCG